MIRRVALVAWICLGMASAARAVEPGEMLQDPALEARARTLSEGLRCLVCQNESIDESHAELAKDIRLLVRQRLVAGDTNEQVRDYLVDRYGQFILLSPPFELQTLLLWGTPIIVLGAGGLALILAARRPRREPPRQLTADETARLAELTSRREA